MNEQRSFNVAILLRISFPLDGRNGRQELDIEMSEFNIETNAAQRSFNLAISLRVPFPLDGRNGRQGLD
ncbi:MAG: hypothetical protein K2X77_28560, partial [Candidatus Obscuribacterales bacterium]|nr:hypothetical protein [Candidatus Obscuribacterales bacterium]